jgi:hypothetical protein
MKKTLHINSKAIFRITISQLNKFDEVLSSVYLQINMVSSIKSFFIL